MDNWNNLMLVFPVTLEEVVLEFCRHYVLPLETISTPRWLPNQDRRENTFTQVEARCRAKEPQSSDPVAVELALPTT